MANAVPAFVAEMVDQLGAGDDEPEPQARSEELGERSQVDHPPVRVQPLQGRARTSLVAELAVLIVLHDDDVVLLG